MTRFELDYIPLQTDPFRNMPTPAAHEQDIEDTPLTDFVMSWAGWFRAVAALAAVALVIITAGAI